ncbi:MAG TPA: hypothetical protein PLV92_30800 [Pirellulaceae bacterium]|nr:hypothetical protein [Pirellulaceae bacterium]
MNAIQPPQPPSTLDEAGREFWRAVVERFDLEAVDLPLLVGACEMLDRAAAARRQVALEGAVVVDRFGQPKEHAAAAVERQSWLTFAKLRRELNVDSVPAPSESRPPLRAAYR